MKRFPVIALLVLAVVLMAACAPAVSPDSAGATFTLTYDGNGSTGGSAPTDSGNYQQYDAVTVTMGSGSLVKTGYSLAGWMTAVDGTGTSYAPGTVFSMKASNTTLYAVWISTGSLFVSAGNAITLYTMSLTSATTAVIPAGVTSLGSMDSFFFLFGYTGK